MKKELSGTSKRVWYRS